MSESKPRGLAAELQRRNDLPSLRALEGLNHAIVRALDDPAVREKLAPLGLDGPPPGQSSPEALRALQDSEIAKWWPIIKAAHVTVE